MPSQIDRFSVEKLIETGYRFEFGEYLTDGFNTFKKNWLMFCLYGFVATILAMLAFLSFFGFLFFFNPIILGFSVGADKLKETNQLRFSDFFGGFKNFREHALATAPLFFCNLLIVLPIFYWILLLNKSNFDDAGLFFAGTFFLMAYGFVMLLVFNFTLLGLFFAPYLVHYGGFTGSEAIKLSFKLVFKNFFWFLLFGVVNGIIFNLGQYLCGIGIFASFAVSVLINYALVKRVLMDRSLSEIDQIGT